MRIPIGPGCALCYLIFSCFGVFMLVIVGLIEQPGHYMKLNGSVESTPEEYIQYADNLFWGAIFYGACCVVCSLRYACHYIENRDKERAAVSAV